MRREGRAALPFTPHPCRLPQPPVHRSRHPSGSQAKAGVPEGAEAAQGHQPRAPSFPTDPTHPGAGTSSAKDKHPPYRTRTHTRIYVYTHTRRHTYTNTRGFFVKAGKWDGVGGEIWKLPSEPPFQLTLQRIEPLDARTQPNAALTYLHTARKSSHC